MSSRKKIYLEQRESEELNIYIFGWIMPLGVQKCFIGIAFESHKYMM